MSGAQVNLQSTNDYHVTLHKNWVHIAHSTLHVVQSLEQSRIRRRLQKLRGKLEHNLSPSNNAPEAKCSEESDSDRVEPVLLMRNIGPGLPRHRPATFDEDVAPKPEQSAKTEPTPSFELPT
jgi:hypothetical protein